ncbi:MAG: lactate utilization protein [Thermoplasmata archaeon]|nr:lactate utilization protein [Thermoplasmata archaeon]
MSAASSRPGPMRLGPIALTPPAPESPTAAFGELASQEQVERTIQALEANGIHAIVVPDRAAARTVVLELLPKGAEVLAASSQTLEAVGLSADLSDVARFDAVRPRLMKLYQEGKMDEQRKIGAAPAFVVGSVHAVTEHGQVVVASASGSQLGPYVYGAGKVIWVVGTQKIVPDLETGVRRVQEYTFPREDARAQKAYGRGSALAKLLVIGKEFQPGRITMVLVKENLGF